MSTKRFLSFVSIFLLVTGCATFNLQDKSRVADAYSHYTLGLLYDNENNFQQAIEEYKQALANDPNSPSIHLRLGIDYVWKEEYSKAIEQIEFVSKSNSQDTRLYFLLAILYTSQKNFTQTIEQYKQIIRLEPNNLIALAGLSDIYLKQEKLALVIPIYEKMLEAEKKASRQAVYCFYLGAIYDKIGKREKAVENFKKVIALNPNNAVAYNYLGYIYAEQGINLDEAEGLIKKAIEIEPRQGAYADSLGWVYYKKALKIKGQEAKEMLKKALEEINRAKELMGDDPVIREHLKDVKEKLKELE